MLFLILVLFVSTLIPVEGWRYLGNDWPNFTLSTRTIINYKRQDKKSQVHYHDNILYVLINKRNCYLRI